MAGENLRMVCKAAATGGSVQALLFSPTLFVFPWTGCLVAIGLYGAAGAIQGLIGGGVALVARRKEAFLYAWLAGFAAAPGTMYAATQAMHSYIASRPTTAAPDGEPNDAPFLLPIFLLMPLLIFSLVFSTLVGANIVVERKNE